MPAYYDEKTKKWFCKFYYRDYDGVHRQKMKRGFPRKRDAKAFEHRFLERDAGLPQMTFDRVCDAYLEERKRNVKASTYQAKELRIRRWIRPALGRLPLAELTPLSVKRWHDWLYRQQTIKGMPLSEGYLYTLSTELSAICNFAVRYLGLPQNPCHIAGKAGHPVKRLRFWTKEEFDLFLSTFSPEDPYRTIFLLLYYTGLRKGELQALTAADFDLKRRVIHVTKTFSTQKGKPFLTVPKTAAAVRDIVLPAFLTALLTSYISDSPSGTSGGFLFPTGNSTLARHLNTHAALAGVLPVTIHELRHSHASLLIDCGFSILLIAERLGHADVRMTLNIYGHLFPSRQRELADRLDRMA